MQQPRLLGRTNFCRREGADPQRAGSGRQGQKFGPRRKWGLGYGEDNRPRAEVRVARARPASSAPGQRYR